MFSRLGNDVSPSGTESPVNLGLLSAKLEAAKFESKQLNRKKATPTQTKVTVTGLGKLVVSSAPAEVLFLGRVYEQNSAESRPF